MGAKMSWELIASPDNRILGSALWVEGIRPAVVGGCTHDTVTDIVEVIGFSEGEASRVVGNECENKHTLWKGRIPMQT